MRAPAGSTAAALAQEFDRGFAAAPAEGLARPDRFLALRLGDDPYAVRVSEIGGLFADRRIVPLPSPEPALLGVAGFRGRIAPVYDVARLLGCPARKARWLVVTPAPGEVALAFPEFEGQLLAAPDRVIAAPAGAAAHSRAALRDGETARVILDIPSVLHAIRARAGSLSVRERSDEP